MTEEVRYLDVLWLDNLIMNFIILWTVWRLNHNRSVLWRIIIASAIGAIYTVVMFMPYLHILNEFIARILLSAIMVILSFKMSSLKEFLKTLAFFYVVTFVYGGTAFGIYFLTSESAVGGTGVFEIYNFPVKLMLISCLTVYILIRYIWIQIRSKIIHRELLYKVEIVFDQKSACFEALLDTGNELCDPISKTPVMVAQYEYIKGVLPEDVQVLYNQSMEGDYAYVTKAMAKSQWIDRVRILPFSAIGSKDGMLLGYKPDIARVFINNSWKEIKDVIVAVHNHQLSKDDRYNALINPEIIL